MQFFSWPKSAIAAGSGFQATQQKPHRLLIAQYAGDVRQAFNALADGCAETYYAQRYSLDVLLSCQQWNDAVGTLVFLTDEVYDEVLPNGIRVMGAGFNGASVDDARLLQMVEAFRPTRLVLRTPNPALLQWAIKHQVRTLVTLADSFQTKGLKNRVWNYRLNRLLSSPWVDWVGNHGINSSLSLQHIGLNPQKIIPWDWPAVITPSAYLPKSHVASPERVNLFFAGSISEAKGIGDVLRAIPLLKQRGLDVQLKAAGKGDIAGFEQEAQQLGIASNVNFLGLVPHHDIVKLMREADIIVIPSRHAYPEGLPMTVYEGFCSRTPIVASDHPMFKGKLQHEMNAMIFSEGNVEALAACVARLCSQPELYQQLSAASAEAWEKLQIQVKWGDLLERWLVDSPENHRWLLERCLTSATYDEQVVLR